MDELRLIQKTTNVVPVQLVVWFLRFLGIYVHEGEQIDHTEAFLKDVYILDDFTSNIISDGIYIVTEHNGSLSSGFREIIYTHGNEKDFLKEFARTLLIENKSYIERNGSSLLNLYTQADIEFLADIFVSSKIMQTVNLTKYFYKNRRLLEYAEQNYKYFLDQLRNYMQINERTVKNKVFLFAQLYAHYEVNCVYKKNDEPLHYDTCFALKQCSNLLEEIGKNHIALQLLMADILFGLQGDSYEAYKIYMDIVLNKDVAYAWYKIGCVYSKIGNDKERFGLNKPNSPRQAHSESLDPRVLDAKQCVPYFEKAVKLKPNYYQTWYRIAMCYEKTNQSDAAIKAYKNVIVNLDHKWQNHTLKPLEVEFSFRSFQRMGKIFSNKGSNPVEVAWVFKNERQIINDIGKQTFLDEILYTENDSEDIKCLVNDKMRQRLETNLNNR